MNSMTINDDPQNKFWDIKKGHGVVSIFCMEEFWSVMGIAWILINKVCPENIAHEYLVYSKTKKWPYYAIKWTHL